MQRTYADLTGTTFWTLGLAENPHVVAIGPYRLNRDDIVGCALTNVTERDTAGRVWTLTLFVAWAVIMLIGVFELGWQTRFLLGAAVLGAIAIMAGVEAMKLKPIVFWRLDIGLTGGRKVSYATASRTDAEALSGALHDIARQNR